MEITDNKLFTINVVYSVFCVLFSLYVLGFVSIDYNTIVISILSLIVLILNSFILSDPEKDIDNNVGVSIYNCIVSCIFSLLGLAVFNSVLIRFLLERSSIKNSLKNKIRRSIDYKTPDSVGFGKVHNQTRNETIVIFLGLFSIAIFGLNVYYTNKVIQEEYN